MAFRSYLLAEKLQVDADSQRRIRDLLLHYARRAEAAADRAFFGRRARECHRRMLRFHWRLRQIAQATPA